MNQRTGKAFSCTFLIDEYLGQFSLEKEGTNSHLLQAYLISQREEREIQLIFFHNYELFSLFFNKGALYVLVSPKRKVTIKKKVPLLFPLFQEVDMENSFYE